MKIGIDIRSALGEKTGVGAYTKELTIALSQIDKKNEYLIFTSEEVAWGLGKNFHQIVRKDRTILQKAVWQLKLWLDVVVLGKVDVFFSTNSVILAILSLPRRIVVLTIHDLVPFVMRETTTRNVRFWFRYLPIAAKVAKKILVPSVATKNDVVKYLAVPEDKIVLTFEGACLPATETTEEQIENVKKKFGIPDKYFLFISTLEPRKNIPNLIRAFSKFSKEDDRDTSLVIGGKKGWLYDEIFQVVKEEGVESKVIFTDYVSDEDMMPLHKGAMAFTFVPLFEGFGLSPLVAMEWGVPVLTSNTSSIPEVVGDAAITVDPNDVDAIAEGMKRLAQDPKLREEMAQKGKKQAAKFSWEKTAQLTLDVFNSIVSNKHEDRNRHK